MLIFKSHLLYNWNLDIIYTIMAYISIQCWRKPATENELFRHPQFWTSTSYTFYNSAKGLKIQLLPINKGQAFVGTIAANISNYRGVSAGIFLQLPMLKMLPEIPDQLPVCLVKQLLSMTKWSFVGLLLFTICCTT